MRYAIPSKAIQVNPRDRPPITTAAEAPVREAEARALLDRQLDVIRGKEEGVPTRHATLRGAIDWSWELLGPTEQTALVQWNALLKSGVYVNMMLPPATPGGASFLRCSISAAHTSEQINSIIEKFANLKSSGSA